MLYSFIKKNNGLAVSGIIDTTTWNNIVANIYPIKLQLSHKGYYNYYTLDGIGNIDLYNAVKISRAIMVLLWMVW